MSDDFVIAGKRFHSRLVIGTGKYASFAENKACIEASGAEMVTVAVRRVNLDRKEESLLDYIPKDVALLPNTAGCYTADDAIRTARLGREAGLSHWVKLEVIGDQKTLMPDNEATIAAAKVLLGEGFVVLPYISDDLIVAKKLADLGCAAVMPLAAPIGSGLGVQNPHQIRLILEAVSVPVIVDAGVGTASDAALAMELGVTALLMNTAIAEAKAPVLMAKAMKMGVEAGRAAHLAGRMPKRAYASASSPVIDFATAATAAKKASA
ncbi:MAG: thiazole synthase [Deltaproteobacteria bacterium]|nr:thiazole synthase [Deltaproteobacteria bacterium]